MAAHFWNDASLHQPKNLGFESGDEVKTWPKEHERSHQRWTRTFKCLCRMKRLWRSQLWTKASSNFCSAGRFLHWWIIPRPSCVLVLKGQRVVPTSKCYQKNHNCILVQTQRHYTSQHIPVRKVLVERNHEHKTLRIWSSLFATRCIVGILFRATNVFKIGIFSHYEFKADCKVWIGNVDYTTSSIIKL